MGRLVQSFESTHSRVTSKEKKTATSKSYEITIRYSVYPQRKPCYDFLSAVIPSDFSSMTDALASVSHTTSARSSSVPSSSNKSV